MDSERGARIIAAAIDVLAEAVIDSAGTGAGLLEIARALVGIERAICRHAEALDELADAVRAAGPPATNEGGYRPKEEGMQ